MRVFLHGIMSSPNSSGLEDVLTCLPGYAERALLVARPWDVVCLHSPPDSDFLDYLRSLGVGPEPGRVVSPTAEGPTLADRLVRDKDAVARIARLIGGRPALLDSFYASPAEIRLARMLEAELGRSVPTLGGPPDVALRVYYKHIVRRAALRLGIPVAPGEVVELPTDPDGSPSDVEPLRRAVQRHLDRTGRVIVRGALGASGCATHVINSSPGSLSSALEAVRAQNVNSTFVVNVMFDLTASPNVQFFIAPDDGAITTLALTDQRFDRTGRYDGNIYPAPVRNAEAMVRAVRKVAAWLRDAGYRGLGGCDFCEYREPATGEIRWFLAELNARINGATYPMALAGHLNRRAEAQGHPTVGAFLTGSVQSTAPSFGELLEDLEGFLFRLAEARGIVPHSAAMLPEGKFNIVVLGRTRGEVEEIHRDFCGAWECERSRYNS
ncbi:MAG: hypothetical protein R6X33_11750 [Candidatus Brocadiia bacterium]